MSVLSNGPFSYNRFDGTKSTGGLGDAYSAIYEKKADKDHDGDGKVESSKDEYFGSKDKAIKKSMGKDTKGCSKCDGGDCECSDKKGVDEGFKPLPTDKMARQANKAYGKEQQAVRAGDQAGANKQMQRRIAMKDPAGRKAVMTKEDVCNFLVQEGFTNNVVSAEVIVNHASDEWLTSIIEMI